MRPVVLLALLAAGPALAADPDEFPVIEAVPVEPVEGQTVEAEDALPIPNLAAPTPVPVPDAAPSLPIPNLAAPTPAPVSDDAAPTPDPAPVRLPLAIAADADPAPAPSPAPDPAPVPVPDAAPAPDPAPLALAIPADAAPVPEPAPPAVPDAEPERELPAPPADPDLPRARPMTAAPWMPAVDRVRSWGRRAGRSIKGAVEHTRDRWRHDDEPAIDEGEPLEADAPTPPFHAGRLPGDDELPLAIPADAPPPPAPPRARTAPPAPPQAADEEPPDHDQPAEADRDDADAERRAGLYVGLSQDLTRVYGESGRNVSIDAGVHLRRSLLVGVSGGALVDARGDTALGWIGLRPGFVLAPDKRVHLRADMLFGIGMAERAQLPVNLFEPRLALELSLGDWARLDAHVSARHVPPAQPLAKDLSGASAGLGLRLGWF